MSCDKGKKRKRTVNTTKEQYEMYITLLENDYAFRSNTINPTLGQNYLGKKWQELAEKLNAIGGGPQLTADEWKKRFTDWKYMTRAKYRKISEYRSKTGSGPPSTVVMTDVEERALSAWGKVAVTGNEMVTIYEGIETAEGTQTMENTVNAYVIEVDSGTLDEDIAPQPAVSATEKLLATKFRFTNIPEQSSSGSANNFHNRAKPLSVLTEKLRENNSQSIKDAGNFNDIIKQFSEDYINLEKQKLEFEKIKLSFEIAKLKFIHPNFNFEI